VRGSAHPETLKSLLLRAEWQRLGGDATGARVTLDTIAADGAQVTPQIRARRLRELAADPAVAVAHLAEARAALASTWGSTIR